ncbi:MAG: hypothetical protein KBB11_04735 [Bacteroidales bacterium]|nr:hypothetical protein [Bacteroidales bacterium]HQP04111.1 threonyl-tRNA synthetase editing domain-containing protein [Bacteroidales bacterium]
MKLLLIYCRRFSYDPAVKTLAEVADETEGKEFINAQVAFIQVEESDEINSHSVVEKLVKNIKWACGKNSTKNVVLHSFAHLSESKAKTEVSKNIFDLAQAKLTNAGYSAQQTPFGFFLDLHIDAPGYSLARIFKSF